MDYLSHNVSVNLKRIRKSKGMSLDVVSEQTGVSKSMLAQIEKGSANPSLGVLGKITMGVVIGAFACLMILGWCIEKSRKRRER